MLPNLNIINYVKTINVTSSVQAAKPNDTFNIYVNLYGNDNFTFIQQTVVTLSYTEGGIIKTLDSSTNNGSVTFYNLQVANQTYVYFSASTSSDDTNVVLNQALVIFATGNIRVNLSSTVRFT